MSFAEPQRLTWFLALAVAAGLLAVAVWQRRRLVARLGDTVLVGQLRGMVWENGRFFRHLLWFLATALTIVSLARPQWGVVEEEIEQQGVQLMIALDISPSMLAEDLQPNRLRRARQDIADLLDLLGGDEVGLVLFSGAAFIQFPLTTDYNTARSYLDSVNPGMISRTGTALEEAIRIAQTGFNEARTSQKVILIVTDGEGHEGDPVAAAAAAADEGVVIYTVGLGSAEGAPIPEYDRRGQLLGYKLDARGETVISRLDEATLAQIAAVGNGRYFRAEAVGRIAPAIAAELETLQQQSLASRLESTPIERFQGFLLVAVIALFLLPLVPERRRGLARVLPLLLAAVLLAGCAGPEAELVAQGNEAFAAADYETALRAYFNASDEAPNLGEPTYNAANVYYRQEGLAEAQSLLERALTRAGGVLAQVGLFNRGNVAYGQGDFGTAVNTYKQALRLNPNDADAKYNLELALQALQAAPPEEPPPQNEQSDEPPPETEQGDNQQSGSQDADPNQDPAETAQERSDNRDERQVEPSDNNESGGEQARPEQLTEEQARELLRAIEQNAETLQEHLQLRLRSGGPAEKDW